MQQLTQKLKSGSMNVLKVPVPNLQPGYVMVRNYYSLISAGTEGSTVSAARKGFIGKVRERPQQVKQVINTLKHQGIVQTYRAVMKKLDAHSPLGYSCVGEVIDVATDVRDFKLGDYVACGGGTASHAEVVCVPVNLCVKIRLKEQGKETIEEHLKQAAYNTLGAIALQGIRQADLRLGENCTVIGLGLLGQLTCLLLKASGVQVIGIDISKTMVEIAAKNGADLSLTRNTPGIENRISDFTAGHGCDAVIITAASSSFDPINFAGAISKKKGTIVVSGAVPTGFDREPHFYKKELTLKMSCSYGPGRYDPTYEEKGHDYPYSYVRWTEKRNMQAFQDLIASGAIDVGYLTTHIFSLDEVPAAYDMIIERSEPFIGILIEYDRTKEIDRNRINIAVPRVLSPGPADVSIGFIGAGSYAQSFLLPNIPRSKDVLFRGVMTISSTGSRSVADRFGFEFCTGNAEDILDNKDINTVFIATRHNTHGEYTIAALKAGKNVFVEKPLCLTDDELNEIRSFFASAQTSSVSCPHLMVGFNRRFSSLSRILRKNFPPGPMAMLYRVNAGFIPSSSWIQDPEVGGGRIRGEVCHFIDYLTWLNGSLPKTVFAAVMETPENLDDTLTINLLYENGSVGTILYCANGSRSLGKEYIEVHQNGCTAVLKDYKELDIYGEGKHYRKKLTSMDKGQKIEVAEFISAIKEGKPCPIPVVETINTTEVTFRVIESLRTGKAIAV